MCDLILVLLDSLFFVSDFVRQVRHLKGIRTTEGVIRLSRVGTLLVRDALVVELTRHHR